MIVPVAVVAVAIVRLEKAQERRGPDRESRGAANLIVDRSRPPLVVLHSEPVIVNCSRVVSIDLDASIQIDAVVLTTPPQ